MPKKSRGKGSYKKYRTFYLPKCQVDLLMVTSHLTPFQSDSTNIVETGLSIIHDILSKSSMFSDDENYPFHVIPMYSKYLQVKYGNDYTRIIQWLINHSVIWNDLPYEGYSSHYYLQSVETCNNLIKSKLSLSGLNLEDILHTYCLKNDTEIINESIDIKGMQKEQKNRIYTEWYSIKLPISKSNKSFLTRDYESDSAFINNAPKHIKQMGSYYRKKLDIDDVAARKHVIERYAHELSLSLNSEDELKAYRRYSSRISAIHSIKNGRTNKTLRFQRNSINNRLDTNLTNMASDLRPFIIGYENFAYLDLVNSQPVLFNVILRKHREDASDSQKMELDSYLHLTTNGLWYEKLEELFKVDRKEAKAIWMQLAYSKNRSYPKLKEVFQKEFPYVSSIIKSLKKEDHTQLAIELQKIESKVFIDQICKALVAEGVIPYTMHDGLLIPKKYEMRTIDIMKEKLEMVIEALPVIKSN